MLPPFVFDPSRSCGRWLLTGSLKRPTQPQPQLLRSAVIPDVANGYPPRLPLRLTANAFVVGVIQGEFQQCAVPAALAAAAACAAHTAACMPHASIARVLKRRCFLFRCSPEWWYRMRAGARNGPLDPQAPSIDAMFPPAHGVR